MNHLDLFVKAKHLKDSMCSQFSDVFTLCQFVMDNSNNAALVSFSVDKPFLGIWFNTPLYSETELTLGLGLRNSLGIIYLDMFGIKKTTYSGLF